MIKEKHPWKQSIEDHDDVYADGYNMVSQPVNNSYVKAGETMRHARAAHCTASS